MIPTDVQKRWLWEQVFGKDGVEFGEKIFGSLVCYRRTRWVELDKEYGIEVIPDIGSPEFLGFMFKYAIPALRKRLGMLHTESLLRTWLNSFIWRDEDPATALFWIVCEAFGIGDKQ